MTDDININGRVLTKLLASLASFSNCQRLEHLDLSHNKLGLPGACALGRALPNLALLANVKLHLTETAIDGEAMTGLVSNALEQCRLVPPIQAFTPILEAFKVCPSCSIELDNNPLGYEGLIAAFKLLGPGKYNLRHLNLKNTNITDSICTSRTKLGDLATCSPSQHDSLLRHNLCLSGNNISGENIVILADCLRAYQPLEFLSTENCSISSNDIRSLLAILRNSQLICSQLRPWNLSGNAINNEGAIAIIEAISDLFPSLREVWINDTQVTDDVAEQLRRCLKANREALETDEEKAHQAATLEALGEMASHEEPNMDAIFQFIIANLSTLLPPLLDKIAEEDIDFSSSTDEEESDQIPTASADVTIDQSQIISTASEHEETTNDASNTSESNHLKIELLKEKFSLDDSQTEQEINEQDFYPVEECFDNYNHYIHQFGLSPAQQEDVASQRDTQSAVMSLLKYWRKRNPYEATFRALIEILLEMKKGDVAVRVCQYLKKR